LSSGAVHDPLVGLQAAAGLARLGRHERALAAAAALAAEASARPSQDPAGNDTAMAARVAPDSPSGPTLATLTLQAATILRADVRLYEARRLLEAAVALCELQGAGCTSSPGAAALTGSLAAVRAAYEPPLR
jgi:hypothetical protein